MNDMFKKIWETFRNPFSNAFTFFYIFFTALGIFSFFYWIIRYRNADDAFVKKSDSLLLGLPYQIDPMAFGGAIIVGVVTIYFIYQQNKISKASLEQNRPMLRIENATSESYLENDIKYSIPRIVIENVGKTEATNINIYFTYINPKEKKVTQIYKNEGSSGITIDPNQKYAINIQESDSLKYQTIIITYKNLSTEKYYLYGTNLLINTGGRFDLNPVGVNSDKWKDGGKNSSFYRSIQ